MANLKKRGGNRGGRGVLGMVLCLLIGFIIGILGTLGGIVGAGFYIYSQPLDKTINLIDKYVPADIYATVFGDDATEGILNEKYAEGKIDLLVGDAVKAIQSLANGGTLSDLNEVSPKVSSLVDKLLDATDKYSLPFEKDALMSTPLKDIPTYAKDALVGTPLGELLEGLGKGNDPLLMAISYGEEGVDYIVNDNGEIVMLGDAKKTTIDDLMSGNFDALLDKVTLDSVMTVDANDSVMCAIAYGSSARYAIVDGEIQMQQITYTYEDKGNGYKLYDDKDAVVNATIESISSSLLKATVDGKVQYLSLDDENIALAYADEELVNPVLYKKTKLGDLTSDSMSLINNIYLKDALGVDATQHKVLISLAYGEEGVDFKYVVKGSYTAIEMIGTAKPRTIGELRERGGNLINDIPLSDIMGVDPEDALVMYLLYGRENIHYALDINNDVVMLQQQIAILGDKVYNEYGEKLYGYTLDTDNATYVAPNGKEYKYVASEGLTVNTEDKQTATVYYLTNMAGDPVYFSRTTLGDMAGSDNVITSLTKRIMLKDVISDEAMNSNLFFKHVQNETIETLPDAINSLTLQQVYEKEIYVTDNDGNFLDKFGHVTTDKAQYVVESEWWYLLHDETVCSGEHGSSCNKQCIEDYVITEFSTLIPNMRRNMETATLRQLKADGMINALDDRTLNSTVKTSIKGIPLNMEGLPTDKEKLGDFTVVEMLNYVNAIFSVIESLESTGL